MHFLKKKNVRTVGGFRSLTKCMEFFVKSNGVRYAFYTEFVQKRAFFDGLTFQYKFTEKQRGYLST